MREYLRSDARIKEEGCYGNSKVSALGIFVLGPMTAQVKSGVSRRRRLEMAIAMAKSEKTDP